MNLTVESSTPDVDLQATISEVRPDGDETFVQNGWIRASERKLATSANKSSSPATHTARSSSSSTRRHYQKCNITNYCCSTNTATALVLGKDLNRRVKALGPATAHKEWCFRGSGRRYEISAGAVSGGSEREGDLHGGARAGRAVQREAAAEGLDAVLEPDQARAVAKVRAAAPSSWT